MDKERYDPSEDTIENHEVKLTNLEHYSLVFIIHDRIVELKRKQEHYPETSIKHINITNRINTLSKIQNKLKSVEIEEDDENDENLE